MTTWPHISDSQPTEPRTPDAGTVVTPSAADSTGSVNSTSTQGSALAAAGAGGGASSVASSKRVTMRAPVFSASLVALAAVAGIGGFAVGHATAGNSNDAASGVGQVQTGQDGTGTVPGGTMGGMPSQNGQDMPEPSTTDEPSGTSPPTA